MKRLIIGIVALMLVFSLACGLPTREDQTDVESTTPVVESTDEPAASSGSGTGDTESTKEAETAETAETEPEDKDEGSKDEGKDEGKDTSSTDDAPFELDDDALAQLSSYRSEMSMTFSDAGETSEGTVEILQEMSVETAEQHVVMSFSGSFPGTEEIASMAEGDQFDFEIYVTEGTQYMRFGEMWINGPVEEDSGFDASDLGFNEAMMDPDNLNELSESNAVKFIGKEKVNGIQTNHYYVEYNDLWSTFGFGDENIESGEADIWISAEADLPKFMVKMDFEMTGELDMGGEEAAEALNGTMTVSINITDINQPITIEIPEAALGGGMPEDLPAYPNAIETNALGTIYSMTTEDDEATVKAFYDEALPENGWELGEEGFMGTTWSKDDRGFTLMITADEDSGLTNILIMMDEGTGE